MTTIYAIPDATPPFLNQIFYKNKTFDENYEILQSKYAFTTSFRDRTIATAPIPKIPCMTPAPPDPPVKQDILGMGAPAATASAEDMSDRITINPYTKCAAKPTVRAPAATVAPIPQNTLYDPSPIAADTLFWSIYIGVYGWGEFEHIRNNYALAEITEKAKIATFLDAAENQKKLKETKYRVSKGGVREIQSDCHTQASTTGFLVVVAMSVFYEKNIWLVDEDRRIFLRFDGRPMEEGVDQTENPCMIIYRSNKGDRGVRGNAAKYTVETCPTGILGLVDRIRTEFVCLDHYESTIKAASNYKMDDLEDMARRLNVDLTANAKWKKIDLYDTIKQKCVWQR